jgi:hypothetical protein
MAPRNTQCKWQTDGESAHGPARRVASTPAGPVGIATGSNQHSTLSLILSDQSNIQGVQAGPHSLRQTDATSQSFTVTSGVLKAPPPGPPVVVSDRITSSGGAAGENQCKVWLEACPNNGRLNNKAKDIITYVCHELLPNKLKFIAIINWLILQSQPHCVP